MPRRLRLGLFWVATSFVASGAARGADEPLRIETYVEIVRTRDRRRQEADSDHEDDQAGSAPLTHGRK